MKLTTRLGVVATLALVAVAYAGLQTAKDEIDKRKVAVTGLWLASPREEMVEVSISVGSKTETRRYINAPVNRVYKVAPGTRVMIRLRLLGETGAKYLGCLVTVDNAKAMETPPHTGVGPGSEAMCWAVA